MPSVYEKFMRDEAQLVDERGVKEFKKSLMVFAGERYSRNRRKG
jgi:hypothetical protein